MDFTQLLFEKYQQKKLAHFYIVSAPAHHPTPEQFLSEWIKQLLVKVIMQEKELPYENALNVLELGHGDILEIKKENHTDRYVSEDFDELIYFQNYYNFEFSHRFAIVHNAQFVSDHIANKLLKTLEEPRPGSTTFFLNSSGQQFLPTIRSRAIEFKLSYAKEALNTVDWHPIHQTRADQKVWLHQEAKKRQLKEEVIEQLWRYLENKEGALELLGNKKIDRDDWQKLFYLLVDLHRFGPSGYAEKETLLEELKWFQLAETFNQPLWERFLGLCQVKVLVEK